MPPQNDRRRFQRIPFTETGRLHHQNGDALVPLIDISLNGAMTELPTTLEIQLDDVVRLDITLGKSDVAIRAQCCVVYIAQTLGLRFTELDLPSATTLRTLLLHRLGDAELVEREIAALIAARST